MLQSHACTGAKSCQLLTAAAHCKLAARLPACAMARGGPSCDFLAIKRQCQELDEQLEKVRC